MREGKSIIHPPLTALFIIIFFLAAWTYLSLCLSVLSFLSLMGFSLLMFSIIVMLLNVFLLSTIATEVQNIQLAEGNPCHNFGIPIYMVFPRLFTCATTLAKTFKVKILIKRNCIFRNLCKRFYVTFFLCKNNLYIKKKKKKKKKRSNTQRTEDPRTKTEKHSPTSGVP